MPSYSSITQGTRLRKRVTLPRPGAVLDLETGKWKGPTFELDVRALTAGEADRVESEARAYAKGLTSDTDSVDDLVDRGRKLHTIALAYVDVDSPPNAPMPVFDGGVEQIVASEELTPELIEFLYEQQQIWQDETNPLVSKMKPVDFVNAVVRTATGEDGDMSFFVSARPGMRWSFALSMARLLATSQTLKSLSGSATTGSPETATEGS